MKNAKEMHGNGIARPRFKRWGARLGRLAKDLAPASGIAVLALGILGWFHFEITRLDGRTDLLNERMATEIQNLRHDFQPDVPEVRDDLQQEFSSVRAEFRGLRAEIRGLRDDLREGFRALNERIDLLMLAYNCPAGVPTDPGRAAGMGADEPVLIGKGGQALLRQALAQDRA